MLKLEQKFLYTDEDYKLHCFYDLVNYLILIEIIHLNKHKNLYILREFSIYASTIHIDIIYIWYFNSFKYYKVFS